MARANREASALTPGDARWVLAVRTASALEDAGGGRIAALPPERRERLVRLATSLGLRPFDAHLVIAIVQDAARSGRSSGGVRALHDPAVVERLTLVPPPGGGGRPQRREADTGWASGWRGVLAQAAAAAALAGAIFALALAWLHA